MVIFRNNNRNIVSIEDIVVYQVDRKNNSINFIVNPSNGQKLSTASVKETRGSVPYSKSTHQDVITGSKRIEKIALSEDGKVIEVTYKGMGAPIKFESSFAGDLFAMQKEQDYYLNNDLIRAVEEESSRKGFRNQGTRAWVIGTLSVLLTAALVRGCQVLPPIEVPAIIKNLFDDENKPKPTPTLAPPSETVAPGSYIGGPVLSTGNPETDKLAADLYNKIKSYNLTMLTEGFMIGNTLVTCDGNLVADAVAQLNGEIPNSMDNMNESDYANRMNVIGQFWVTVIEAALNPNNQIDLTIGNYVKDPTVRAMVTNSEAAAQNFMYEASGLTPVATFVSSPTENVKLNQGFKTNQERFIAYQLQTEGDSVLQMASQTANFVVFSMFTCGNDIMKDDAYIFEGTINGEKVRWPYIKYIDDVTGGSSWEAVLEADDRVSFVEYNAYGKKTGKILSQNEMIALDKSSVNVCPQGFSTEMDNMKDMYMQSMQKRPEKVYNR